MIGGGVAGATAALSAAAAGARVALVRSGPGATALSGGGWFDAPPPELRHALEAAGYPLEDCAHRLPHPDGVLVPCSVAAPVHAAAQLSTSTLVCGIAGLPAFRAPALAALWSHAAGLSVDDVQAVTISIDATPSAGWSPASLAGMLDRNAVLLADALSPVVRERSPARVILPAIAGLNDHARVATALRDACGVPVAEALGVAPSVPGWRLDRALMNAVANAGVHVVAGRLGAGEQRDGLLRTAVITGAGASTSLSADAWVLATGKYIGGGITADDEFEEPALGCDVALERFSRTIDDPGASLVLTDPVRTEPQPALAAGVQVNAEGQPLHPSGSVFLANVFAAGSVRAGVEAGRLGLGSAAHQGWTAGARAAGLTGRKGG